jgi:hypothetical protein
MPRVAYQARVNSQLPGQLQKKYHSPATPYQRLLADARINEEVRHMVEWTTARITWRSYVTWR